MTKESKQAKIEVKKQTRCFTELGITVEAETHQEALEKLEQLQSKKKADK